jgi:hypothetical protein
VWVRRVHFLKGVKLSKLIQVSDEGKAARKLSSNSLFEVRRGERKVRKQPSVEICVLSEAYSYNFGHVHIVDESIFFCDYNTEERFGHP